VLKAKRTSSDENAARGVLAVRDQYQPWADLKAQAEQAEP
jgi:hypothetical protein